MMAQVPTTPTLNAQAMQILTDFKKQSGVTQENHDVLLDAINSSPFLIEQFNQAASATKYPLKGLTPLTGTNMGGSFNPNNQTINVSLTTLTRAANQQNEVVFVFAHELQHSLNHKDMVEARKQFRQEVNVQAQQKSPRDYTDEAEKLLTKHREDEATAELAGFNALVSKETQLKQKNQQGLPTLADLYNMNPRMKDFIDYSRFTKQYSLKSNLTINPDMTLSDSQPNIDAMGVNYYDKSRQDSRLALNCPQTGCQANDLLDYQNYYGNGIVNQIIAHEQAYNKNSKDPIHLNMTKLGLTEEMLEEGGLDIPSGHLHYQDIGQNPPFIGKFDHTKSGNNVYSYVPIEFQKELLQPENLSIISPKNQKLFEHCEDKLIAYCRENGITADSPQDYKNIAMAMTAEMVEQRMNKIEQIGFKDNNLIAISYEPNLRMISITPNDVVNIPIQESMEKIQQTEQAIQQQNQEKQMMQSQQQGYGRSM